MLFETGWVGGLFEIPYRCCSLQGALSCSFGHTPFECLFSFGRQPPSQFPCTCCPAQNQTIISSHVASVTPGEILKGVTWPLQFSSFHIILDNDSHHNDFVHCTDSRCTVFQRVDFRRYVKTAIVIDVVSSDTYNKPIEAKLFRPQ